MLNRSFNTILTLFLFCACISCSDTTAIPESANLKSGLLDSLAAPDNYLLDETVADSTGPVYMVCEHMPEFPGGENAFNEYLRTHIHYPPGALTQKIEGRVNLRFIIDTAGRHQSIKIIRGIRNDMDEQCIRALEEMPDWKPGRIGSKPVAVSYGIAVRFLLTKSGSLNGIYILP